jgi:hypothetical protein
MNENIYKVSESFAVLSLSIRIHSEFQSHKPLSPTAVRTKVKDIMAEDKIQALHAQMYEDGLAVRRAVVGATYVNSALAKGSTEFAAPMQELVTEWCWGDIWNRPGLERKQRSLLSKSLHRISINSY